MTFERPCRACAKARAQITLSDATKKRGAIDGQRRRCRPIAFFRTSDMVSASNIHILKSRNIILCPMSSVTPSLPCRPSCFPCKPGRAHLISLLTRTFWSTLWTTCRSSRPTRLHCNHFRRQSSRFSCSKQNIPANNFWKSAKSNKETYEKVNFQMVSYPFHGRTVLNLESSCCKWSNTTIRNCSSVLTAQQVYLRQSNKRRRWGVAIHLPRDLG